MLLAILIIAHVGGGALMGALFPPNPWLGQLVLPSFYPPDWSFPVVWPILYVLMAVALWLVVKSRSGPRKTAISLHVIQMVVNYAFMPLFFGLQNTLLGMVDVVVLLVLLLITVACFYKVRKIAALLMAPYVMWVSFACVLSFSLWWMNA
ncbi:MAG: tryptophan-rich sensory protein [Desulfovibrio sp.]|mgnify:CR=1 FL=1|nr:MAG: tryptophan-rich sensory protein [Desulfovibrio sp.]